MSRFSLIFIGSFTLLISLFSFLNIIYSYYLNLFLNINTYFIICLFTLTLGLFLIFFKRIHFKKINIYEKILIVIIGYLFFPVIISLPFYFSINNISYLNSYFEAISGFTSTGFTIFENIKHIDQSLIIWRSSTQWIGGLYFLFSIIYLIDIYDDSFKKTLTNFISFNSSEILKQATKIFILYSSLTILIFGVLNIFSIRTFDSLNLALTIIHQVGFYQSMNYQ